MLTCKQVVEQASEYIDQNLSLGKKIEFLIHRLLCVHCRQFLAIFKRMYKSDLLLIQNNISDEKVDEIIKKTKTKILNRK